jgi:protein-tyrosine phosphatase
MSKKKNKKKKGGSSVGITQKIISKIVSSTEVDQTELDVAATELAVQVEYEPLCMTSEHSHLIRRVLPPKAFGRVKAADNGDLVWMCEDCIENPEIGQGIVFMDLLIDKYDDYVTGRDDGGVPYAETMDVPAQSLGDVVRQHSMFDADDGNLANTYKPFDDWELSSDTVRTVWDSKTGKNVRGSLPKFDPRTCSHNRQPFSFKDSDDVVRTIYCSAHSDKGKPRHKDAKTPDLSVWLASSWMKDYGPVWSNAVIEGLSSWDRPPAVFLDWPDMQDMKLDDVAPVVEVIASMLSEGRSVEIGCIGAHGRTGTLVSLVMVRFGYSAEQAIAGVREFYCKKAVETKKQESMVEAYSKSLSEGVLP